VYLRAFSVDLCVIPIRGKFSYTQDHRGKKRFTDDLSSKKIS